MKRVIQVGYWTVPSLLCLAIYWFGLRAWFQQDDFAWLRLDEQLRRTGDLWALLFAPRAQGTIRPLSERAFFLVFYRLFGLDALPFRIVVFLTQFANLVLLSSIAWRLTRSRAAGFLAPVLWIANSTLATVMAWTSAYNQVLCAFFLLASFWSLLLYVETGKRRYLALQWGMFLLGFGALEINVVYPAIAAAFVFLTARKYLRSTLWLFLPSLIYAFVHFYYAPTPVSGPYRMHWDLSMFRSLRRYWAWAMGPLRLDMAGISLPHELPAIVTLVLTAGILVFVLVQLRKRNSVPAFLLLWFLILLAPVLPLRDHLSDHYLTMPTIGLAVLAAWGLVEAWKSRWFVKTVTVSMAVLYLASSVTVGRAVTQWRYQRSRVSRNLVMGLVRAHELHPDKLILLTGVSSDLFWSTINDKAHLLAGARNVYLVPGSEATIEAHPELGAVSEFVLPSALAIRALEEDRAVVYSAGEDKLRNVTTTFQATARARWGQPDLPSRVDAGNALFSDQLGPTWYPIDVGFRWMPKRATVVLRGPAAPGARLFLTGYCPAAIVKTAPLHVTVSVDGAAVGQATLAKPDAGFELDFPLPPQAVGKAKIEVAIELDRTFVLPSDGRQLGLTFGTISVR
jgi:hypothetical protein